MKPFFCWIILFLLAIFVFFRSILVISIVTIPLELISDVLDPAINAHGNLLFWSTSSILTVARKSWFIKLLWVITLFYYIIWLIILKIIVKRAGLMTISRLSHSKHRLYCFRRLKMSRWSILVWTRHIYFIFIYFTVCNVKAIRIKVFFLTCSDWSIIICSLTSTTTAISIAAIVSLITCSKCTILGLDLSYSWKVGRLRVL